MAIRGLYSGGADDWVYFEHQKSTTRLCGLHCLNNLVQAPHYTQSYMQKTGVDLSKLERSLGGTGEGHWSLDGYYSADVMIIALAQLNLKMTNVRSPEFKELHTNPTKHSDAFILNLQDHWLAVRPVKGRWFSLDSLRHPEPIPESRINSFVTSLQSQSWTLFVVRPNQWPEVKMPEPRPKEFAEIPKITSGSLQSAAFYSFSALSQLQDEDGASPEPAEKPLAARAWPSGGGQTWGGSPVRATAGAVEDDPILAEVIRITIKEFKESVPSPPEEPLSGGVALRVQDVTSAAKSRPVSRRFPGDCACINIFRWLFKDEEIWASAGQALGSMDRVILSAQFPNRRLICLKGARVLFETEGASSSAPQDVTEVAVSKIFVGGAETLRLTEAS